MSKELLENTKVQTVNVISMDKELLVPQIVGSYKDNSAGNIFAEEYLFQNNGRFERK